MKAGAVCMWTVAEDKNDGWPLVRTDLEEGRDDHWHWNVMQNNDVQQLMETARSCLLFFQYLEDPDGILIDLIMPDNEYVNDKTQ